MCHFLNLSKPKNRRSSIDKVSVKHLGRHFVYGPHFPKLHLRAGMLATVAKML